VDFSSSSSSPGMPILSVLPVAAAPCTLIRRITGGTRRCGVPAAFDPSRGGDAASTSHLPHYSGLAARCPAPPGTGGATPSRLAAVMERGMGREPGFTCLYVRISPCRSTAFRRKWFRGFSPVPMGIDKKYGPYGPEGPCLLPAEAGTRPDCNHHAWTVPNHPVSRAGTSSR
jgi:hypothetical protein